jgi:hypothetical protein
MQEMRLKYYHFVAVFLLGLSLLAAGPAKASPAKFDIPVDFPGDFRIDFLGTDYIMNGSSAGSLSTASTVDFSVGSETSAGSGIYNISVDPQGFNFLGFEVAGGGWVFDVYGAGEGNGTFDTNTGHWDLNMPTLFVNYYDDGYGGLVGNATREDFYLTTQNVLVPGDDFSNPAYWTTTASPMVLNEASPDPWGDLNLVVGDLVDHTSELTLTYDWGLINTIATGYDVWSIDLNTFVGIQYEFDIYGNDPIVSSVPVPAAAWLFGSGLIGLFGFSRRRNHA